VDPDLIARAQRGDRDAYELLARGSVERLFRTAHRIVRDVDRADDAVQQTLVAMWRELPSLRDPARFEAWTYRLVVRFCLVESRRARRSGIREIRVDDLLPATTDSFADAELRDQLDRALGDLSPDHRAVVVLHHYAGLSLAEIAAILDVPYGTVGSRLHHALRLLRSALAAGDRSPVAGGQPA
jgi:RNA polymerase sigma-70 factor, ECF subfamily